MVRPTSGLMSIGSMVKMANGEQVKTCQAVSLSSSYCVACCNEPDASRIRYALGQTLVSPSENVYPFYSTAGKYMSAQFLLNLFKEILFFILPVFRGTHFIERAFCRPEILNFKRPNFACQKRQSARSGFSATAGKLLLPQCGRQFLRPDPDLGAGYFHIGFLKARFVVGSEQPK
jgi:hypothetical protein